MAARGSQPANAGLWSAWVHLFDRTRRPRRTGRASDPAARPTTRKSADTDSSMLGQFLARLEATHALTPTLIVLTADHCSHSATTGR